MIGKQLGGRYELLERVGGGGMAVVYKAKDVLLNRMVAVKVLRSQFAGDEDFVKRFRREAQAAASLSHPNIVSIYDIGIEEDVHFIVMEYIAGSNLKEYIKRHAPLPIDEAVEITKQIAEALAHAHQNHIIHRDIKPHNILISEHGSAKVTDFGIARAVTSATITHTGSVMGSVHYFSPEQARGGMTGEKSDIYSLGVVLYEMVTGELPFSGESPISVALKHLQDTFTEPRELNPEIPQSVENIITRSLAKDADKRYASAIELIDDLRSCLQADRLSEAKIELDNAEDEEATKVLPIIDEDMFDTQVASPKTNKFGAGSADDYPEQHASDEDTHGENREDQTQADHTGHPNNEDDEDDEQVDKVNKRTKRSKWKVWLLAMAAVLTLLLFSYGVYKGFQFVNGIFYVQEVEVEDVTDLPFDEAKERLMHLRLHVNDPPEETYSDEVEEGHVIRQIPTAGSKVKEGSTVELTVSLGKEEVEMPSVVNLTEPNGLRMLSNLNIPEENITIERDFHAEIPAGHIVSQSPLPGELIIPDETEVTLVISQGLQTFEMPDLKGLTAAEAESQLNRNHLVLNKVEEEHSNRPEGEVIRQFPVEPGQQVEAGTPITLFVSLGPEEEVRTKVEKISVVPVDEEGNDQSDQEGKQKHTDVEIVVDDLNGERKVVDEKINQKKDYEIEVSVDPQTEATISVFLNGDLTESKEVHYES